LTLEAVQSLVDHLPEGSEIFVVDNASGDGTPAALRERHPEADVIELGENVGFGRANNIGLGRATGDYLLLLNSDARLTDVSTVPRMIERMRAEPNLAVVGPRLQSADGQLERSARSFPTLPKEIVRRLGLYLVVPRAIVGRWLLGDFWSPSDAMHVDWLTAACMLVRRDAYETIGGFDPRIFMYGEEQEWCRRFKRAGWDVLYEPGVSVVHQRAASGPPGNWRVRAALEGDVRIFRWTHGKAKAMLFNLVRLAGFLLEAAALSVTQVVRDSDYIRQRRALAWQAFRQQLLVSVRHPFG
jgi:GT2 family glycosyltransferase